MHENIRQMPLNHGLIEMPNRPADYIFGIGNAVASKELVPSGDWRPWLSRSEKQYSLYFDTMGCVSFSALNCIETVLNYKISHNLVHQDDLAFLKDNGYLDDKGKVNCSDRFLAKVSGTTKDGNWLYRVADAIREFGCVPEVKWAYPREQRDPVFDWDSYYSPIPEEIYQLGEEFAKRFKINNEWVKDNFDEARKRGILQVTLFAWANQINGVYQDNFARSLNHAVAHSARQEYRLVEDQYDPAEKRISHESRLGEFAMLYTITNKLPEEDIMKITLYKGKDDSAVYEFWADGLYHPIAHESYVIKKYGDWEHVNLVELDSINETKIGSLIGEYSWFAAFINKLFGK